MNHSSSMVIPELGTGCSARMAVLHGQGRMGVGDRYRARSIIGSEFECGIDSLASLGETDAIVPTVSGRAWITGTQQLMLDPDDPWPEGYRIADTWPGKRCPTSRLRGVVELNIRPSRALWYWG